ncbi:VRR-NUC domain-containing protein [Roseicella sp. DB1501]|uniref:VRR-NUC domain-containing protein n=1 Tax=Roseicella sp. DB1501 TaxID=2730925 RepID=UPI00149097DE|nr:VRR-NUC domain-containing protein [Roseicella sp. DB1501]NOG73743.1 VRR-NUC domain-containing protein [Roseicella sp. DB1501]
MTLFLGRDPAAVDNPWHEWQLQAFCIQEARRAGYLVHGDQNGAHKSSTSASMAKATGMQPGWPDLCFAVPVCPIWIELKTADGRLSTAQRDVHAHMAAMGYPVHTVYADCPASAWSQVSALLPDPTVFRAMRARDEA